MTKDVMQECAVCCKQIWLVTLSLWISQQQCWWWQAKCPAPFKLVCTACLQMISLYLVLPKPALHIQSARSICRSALENHQVCIHHSMTELIWTSATIPRFRVETLNVRVTAFGHNMPSACQNHNLLCFYSKPWLQPELQDRLDLKDSKHQPAVAAL